MVQAPPREETRRDALQLGAAKLAENCAACAERQFALARQHGAGEDEIAAARASGEQRALNRRDLLKLAAAGAAGLTAAPILSPLITLFAPSPTLAQTVDAANVAWVVALRSPTPPPGQPTVRLIGISPNGSIAGQVDPAPGSILRTARETELIEATSEATATTAAAVIDVFDAATGRTIGEITGRALPLHGPQPQSFDALVPTLSPDGRLLAVLHQTRGIQPGTEQQAIKPAASGTTNVTFTTGQMVVANSVELFDLQAGQAVAFQDLGASPTNNLGGYPVFAPDDQLLYVFTTQDVPPNQQANPTIRTLTIANGQLQPGRLTTNGVAGQTLPAPAIGGAPSLRFLPDGVTLVRFEVPNHVRFLDTATLTITTDLDIGTDPLVDKAAVPIGLFTPDGSTLYVVNLATGTVRTVDLSQRALVRTVALPLAGSAQTSGGRSGSVDAAALAPDASRLYLVDGRAATGLTVVHLPDLQVEATWLPDQQVSGVWPAPNGQTVFVRADSQVYSLQSDGTVAAVAPIGSPVLYFISGQ